MSVHHLNCGTLRPRGLPAMVCHVLLVETGDGLVLVDSGYGLADIADPGERLGFARHIVRPVLDPEETAARQIEVLGFARTDVRHIVVTHFDSDHIGGIADFPHAEIHVTSAEARAAIHDPTRQESFRYRAVQWAHGPKLVEHGTDGDVWRGFAAAREVLPGIVMVALPGHTRGHAAVAVDTGDGWLLHAGDAFFHHATLDGRSAPRGIRLQERAVAFDHGLVRANHARLAELHRRGDADLTVICAHDPDQLSGPRG